MTGLGAQLGKLKHGIGTTTSYLYFLTYEGKSAQEIKETLESFDIPGTGFNIKKLKRMKAGNWLLWSTFRLQIGTNGHPRISFI